MNRNNGFKLIVFIGILNCTSAVTTTWIRSFDDLSDYALLRSESAASVVQCTALVGRLNAAGMQLVAFNSATRVCTMYKCALSLPDCRKCRNVNSSNQQVWIPSSNADTCWTTVQHRVSNSVDFYRNWTEYRAGFGDGPNGNFWIGLSTLYSLASGSSGRKLRFMMKAWNGSESWAQYSSFSVGPESDGFRLSVSGFSSSHGVIGDSLSSTSGGFKFTTKDADNDNWSGNCAVTFANAWWFNGTGGACGRMGPNGPFQMPPSALSTAPGMGVIWADGYGFTYSLMDLEMLIL